MDISYDLYFIWHKCNLKPITLYNNRDNFFFTKGKKYAKEQKSVGVVDITKVKDMKKQRE